MTNIENFSNIGVLKAIDMHDYDLLLHTTASFIKDFRTIGGKNLVLIAAEKGDVKLMNLAIDKNCNLLHCDENGEDVIDCCLKSGDLQVLKHLLALDYISSLINNIDHNGNTPAIKAAQLGSWDALRLLCKNGANVHYKNGSGDTAKNMWDAEFCNCGKAVNS